MIQHQDMIARTSLVNFGVLVIDAPDGDFEAGFAHDGHTCEHENLANALVMKQMICYINKTLLLFV